VFLVPNDVLIVTNVTSSTPSSARIVRPTEDPSDIKAVWELGQDIRKRHPKGGVAIGVEVYKAHCKPGADIPAIALPGGHDRNAPACSSRSDGPLDREEAGRGLPYRRPDSNEMDRRGNSPQRVGIRCRRFYAPGKRSVIVRADGWAQKQVPPLRLLRCAPVGMTRF
jgi:hypothetical protein